MPATKAYTRVNFENYPSTNTPLNATNLNKVDKGIDDLDDLLVTARNNIETLQSNATTDEANILALQGSVAALNGFTFYPAGEVDLVALVADDSFYKDANNKYVLADSTTGQALIDGVTYKALASTEDTRGEVGADTATPFKGGKYAFFLVKFRSATGRDFSSHNDKDSYFVIDMKKLEILNFSTLTLTSTYGSATCLSTFTVNSVTISGNILNINMTLTVKGNGSQYTTSQEAKDISLTAQINGNTITLINRSDSVTKVYSGTLDYTTSIYLSEPFITS